MPLRCRHAACASDRAQDAGAVPGIALRLDASPKLRLARRNALKIQNPKIQNPKIQNLKSEIAKSQIQNPKSKIQDPKVQNPKVQNQNNIT